MKERPILFSASMVRAILEGRKTQTRRVVKPQPGADIDDARLKACIPTMRGRYAFMGNLESDPPTEISLRPRAFPGDRLWVKETWWMHDDPSAFDSRDGNVTDSEGRRRLVGYAATMDCDSARIAKEYGCRKRPSIHMPRWASRITLEVVGVRVERVRDISEGDAVAEGFDQKACAAVFEKAAGGVEMKYGRWLEKAKRETIEGDWCVECVGKAAKKHKAEIRGWDDYPESDSPLWCEECGALITHSLTQYGVDAELGVHERADDRTPAVKCDAAILANLASGIGDLRPEHMGRLAQIAFLTLFYGLNKRAEPDANPWVWVVEFKRVEPSLGAAGLCGCPHSLPRRR